jgi:hypothetical protein
VYRSLFRVEGLGFDVKRLVFRVQGSGLTASLAAVLVVSSSNPLASAAASAATG